MTTVTILHPDLGLGGAERLVVDVAAAAERTGRSVEIWTCHYDVKRCFEETLDMDVFVLGDHIPRSFLGHAHVLFAVLRFSWLCAFAQLGDVVMVDQISHVVWILLLRRCFRRASFKLIFYCHHPDSTLAPKGGGALQKIYRFFIDAHEKKSTLSFDKVVCNSEYTRKICVETFGPEAAEWTVVYPIVSLTRYTKQRKRKNKLVLSLNRFEEKKNLPLVVAAFESAKLGPNYRLVLAGGCDPRVQENVRVLKQLKSLASHDSRISFETSISDSRKRELLSRAKVLVYTPENEHFGIVPLEAMASGTPVVACDSGGPTETVADGVTGYLVAPNVEAFAQAIAKAVDSNMAEACVFRARQFSPASFDAALEKEVFGGAAPP